MSAVHKYFTVVILTLFPLLSQAQNDIPLCHVHDDNAYAREHLVDMQHMLLEVELVPEIGKVIGKVKYDFTALRKQVDTIFLDAPGIDIEKVTLDEIDVKYDTNKDGLIIRPSKPLVWGTEHTLYIEYKAQPRKGIYFIGWNDPNNKSRKQVWTQGQGIDNRYWIPSFDDMSDKLTTEIKISFDSKYKVLSNGKLIKEKAGKDGKTFWHYRMDQPHPPYLVMLGIGEYGISSSKSASGVQINNWYYPDMPERIEPTYRYTTEMMNWMEKEFGVPYPWHEYSQIPVQDFMYGAMENTTATIFGDFYVVDERAFLDRYYIGTNAHELVHQWFGDYVTARSPEHVWLQESFATHYQKHFERHIFGEDHYQWNRRTELWRVLSAGKNDDKPIAHSSAGSARIYPKGSLTLDMIKYLIGREQYNKALQYYLKKHPYQSVETHDFMLAFYETLGIDLEWFFDQWIWHGGEPHYEVSYQLIPAGNGADARTEFTVKQTHERNDVVGLFRMPIVFEVHYTDGTKDSVKEWVEDATQTVTVPNKDGKEVAYVLFDPNYQIIKGVTFDKPTDMLIAQALNAEHMIDRYDAAVALRGVAIADKQDALVELFKKEPFWAVRREVVRQLINAHTELPEGFYLSMLKDPNADVRNQTIQSIEFVPEKYLTNFEALLTDSSYNVVEDALVKLAEQYPTNTEKYLELTKNDQGIGNKVRIAWLEIAVAMDPDKYMPELVEYASNSYEFITRTYAMKALTKFNHLDEKSLSYMVDAAFSPNRRLAGPATEAIKSYMSQTYFAKRIQQYHLQGTWTDWQEEIWKGILK